MFSTSHHIVSTDGQQWHKSPDPAVSYALNALENEVRALRILGLPHSWDGHTIITPHCGSPVEEVSESVAQKMAERLQSAPVVLAGSGLRTAAHIPDRTRDRIVTRTEGLPDWIAETCHRWLPDQGAPEGSRLVHTDPHPGNWVQDTSGELHLLDWESAIIGPVEIDLAALWHSMIVQDRPMQAQYMIDVAEDREAFCWGLRSKCATGLSWVGWKLGEQRASERRDLLLEATERIGVPLA